MPKTQLEKPKTPKKTHSPFKFTAPQLEETVNLYLEKIKTESKIPFLQDFCLFAGLSMSTLNRYEQFANYAKPLKRLRLSTERGLIDKGLTENKPIFSMFLLKSLFGYKEGTNLDITSGGQPLGVVMLPPRVKK